MTVNLSLSSIAIVTGVAVCVTEALAETEGGLPKRICPLVPGAIAWDNCECGQFAQTIVSITPTSVFPQPAVEDQKRCGAPMLLVTVIASMTRCVPGPDENNARNPFPSCESLFAAARILEEDRHAVRNAIRCCLLDFAHQYRIHHFNVGASNSVGPEGMCAGSEVTYTFTINAPCCD